MAGGKPLKTIILRGIAVLAYFVAALVMFLSYQKVDKDSITFIARYSDWNSFTNFATANCVGCVYNLIITIIPSGSPLWKTIIVLDVVVNLVMGASLGAGWETYSVIKCGNIHYGWAPMCDAVVPFFCNKSLGSLICSSIGLFSSFFLLMLTLNVSVDPLLLGAQS